MRHLNRMPVFTYNLCCASCGHYAIFNLIIILLRAAIYVVLKVPVYRFMFIYKFIFIPTASLNCSDEMFEKEGGKKVKRSNETLITVRNSFAACFSPVRRHSKEMISVMFSKCVSMSHSLFRMLQFLACCGHWNKAETLTAALKMT
jgi:hypothetical protein